MCKLSDEFSGFVDTCGTGKHNRVGTLVLGNERITKSAGIVHLKSPADFVCLFCFLSLVTSLSLVA